MKWHDDLSKWQERLGQVGGLLSVGAGFVLRDTYDAEQPRREEPEPPTDDAANPPEPNADR